MKIDNFPCRFRNFRNFPRIIVTRVGRSMLIENFHKITPIQFDDFLEVTIVIVTAVGLLDSSVFTRFKAVGVWSI